MTIHPKTSGAATGGALGVLIVSILGSIHGVNLTDAANAAIPTFLGTLGAWLVPSGNADAPAPTSTPTPVTPTPPTTTTPVV